MTIDGIFIILQQMENLNWKQMQKYGIKKIKNKFKIERDFLQVSFFFTTFTSSI